MCSSDLEGTHRQLVRKRGHYAYMWNMQVGGFLPEDIPDTIKAELDNDDHPEHEEPEERDSRDVEDEKELDARNKKGS